MIADEVQQSIPQAFIQFRRNQLELALFHGQIDVDNKRILEIGGGVSGQASWLADKAQVVISTDLYETTTIHGDTHALRRTKESEKWRKLQLLYARAEQLPLLDASVDCVFSSFVLEHVADRARSLSEMHRVLRDHGIALAIVPSVREPLLRWFWHVTLVVPRYIVGRLLARSKREDSKYSGKSLMRVIFPGPHGEYDTRRQEFLQSTHRSWNELFAAAGFHVERRFTISFEQYFPIRSDEGTLRYQRWLLPLIRRFGATSLGRALGTSYCVVARKGAGMESQNSRRSDISDNNEVAERPRDFRGGLDCQ